MEASAAELSGRTQPSSARAPSRRRGARLKTGPTSSGDGAQRADQLIGFEGERLPRRFVAVEGAGAADLLERARRIDNGFGVEVRGRAFEAVRGAAQRFRVARVERLADPFEVARCIVDEEDADLSEPLTIAAH